MKRVGVIMVRPATLAVSAGTAYAAPCAPGAPVSHPRCSPGIVAATVAMLGSLLFLRRRQIGEAL